MQPSNNNDKFLIIKNIKNFILSLEKLLVTFPKKDMFTKNMVYEDALEVLELVSKANYDTRVEIKKTYQIEALAKINKIDFYLERAYKFKYISERQCMNAIRDLEKINRMLYSWCNNEK